MIFRITKNPKHLPPYQENIELRRLKLDLICYHKILNNKIIIANDNRPSIRLATLPRRLSKMTSVLGSRTQLRHQSFLVRMSKVFNKLPNDIAHLNEPIEFKVALGNLDLSSLL